MREQRQVLFSGRVQGVGFRWTAKHIASLFPVLGWVRNRADGKVELVIEGEAEDLDGYLRALRQALGRNIAKETAQTAPAAENLRGFEIRF